MTDKTVSALRSLTGCSLWVIASFAAFMVGFGAWAVLGSIFFPNYGSVEFINGFLGVMMGISLAIAQLLVWRFFFQRRVFQPGWWFAAGMVGFGVALAMDSLLGMVMVGVSIGIAQWFVLWRRVPLPEWWMLASIVGLVVTFALNASYGRVVGALVGAMTGFVIVLLLRRALPVEPNLPQETA